MRGISVPVLDLCPNMTTLVVRTPTPSSINLLPTSPHASLKTLSVTWSCRAEDPRNYNDWETFMTTFDLTLLPSLEEIRPFHLRWPQGEHNIAVSAYVHWAEILLERNLHLVNEQGKRWRARLRVKGGPAGYGVKR
ncbi:hypothetical protein C8F01DRAFT_35793 [Mycena amicta]|nr:hypothetical protein C8F01DRAFT_35793 [Mycena amicta]